MEAYQCFIRTETFRNKEGCNMNHTGQRKKNKSTVAIKKIVIHTLTSAAYIVFFLLCAVAGMRIQAQAAGMRADTVAAAGTQVLADPDGDGKTDSVSVQDLRDGNDAYTQVTAWMDGLAHAQKDYEGAYASFVTAGDLTGNGKADVLVVRCVQEGYRELELSVLHLEDGRWEAYPGRLVHHGELDVQQPFDFTDSWHDTYIGAAIVQKDGKNMLRLIMLPDADAPETMICTDVSYNNDVVSCDADAFSDDADRWIVEDAQVIKNDPAGRNYKNLLGDAYACQEQAMRKAVTYAESGGQDPKLRPKKNTSDADEAAVMEIIAQQEAAGVRISTNLADERFYTWSVCDGAYRLTGICWDDDVIDDPQLTGSISFAGLPELRSLKLRGSRLTQIDLGGNPVLEYLNCGCSQLKEIDVSHNPLLKTLYCYDNQLTSLDLGGNPKLQRLNCAHNQLTEINTDQNKELEELSCGQNLIEKLELLQNPGLKALDCTQNRLKELDVSRNQQLEELSCGSNQLKKLKMAQNKKLGLLDCSINVLTDLNVSQNTGLYYLDCHGNRLKALDVSRNQKLGALCCGNNRLKALDVSHNPKLAVLDCGNNFLKELDVSRNGRIEEMICSGNRLKTLDVGGCPVLHRLDCARNQLGHLKLGSKKGFFVELVCEKNQLKKLDISGIRLWEDGIFRHDRQVKIIGAADRR